MRNITAWWKSQSGTMKFIYVAIVLVICSVLFSLVVESTPTSQTITETQVNTSTPIPTDTLAPTNTPIPEDTPTSEPVVTLSPEEQLRVAIETALGSGNRDIDRISLIELDGDIINVHWTINDNLTDNIIRRSAKSDVQKMLKAIDETEIAYYLVNFEGTFSLIDQLGNIREETVVWGTYPAETVKQINWERFLFDNMWDIASTSKQHPIFED